MMPGVGQAPEKFDEVHNKHWTINGKYLPKNIINSKEDRIKKKKKQMY